MQLNSQMLNRGCAPPQKLSQLTPITLKHPSFVARKSTRQCRQSDAHLTAAHQKLRSAQRNFAPTRAAATEAVTTVSTDGFDINEAIKRLRQDLDNQMATAKPSPDLFDETVIFRDPITKVDGLKNYTDIIGLFLTVKPTFELHDMRPCGPYTAVARWTMVFPVVPDNLPRPWTPKVTFTGTTTYGFSPATKKVNAHIDTWDLTDEQDWFSVDGASVIAQQILESSLVPGPQEEGRFRAIRRRPDYEIRDYEPSAVTEAFREGPTEINPSVFMGRPAIEPAEGQLGGDAPRSFLGTVAARRFAGSPPNWLLGMAKPEDEAKKLMDALRRDGVPFDESAGYRLVRYEGPNPLPQGKPNEILVRLDPSYNPVWSSEQEIEALHRFHYKVAK
uniref:Uncharacterized protein n=1 Tax=Dunaliella tertiolecta TaxID=3047 RepID=A0A7S3VUE7_DUNTE|mmetsp:Transcript_5917/g.15739  ORF Transcript_5917/g.15739 Transcript_5917/m.15739 type:complete len:389 (-) Transcript_5917:704-1870(-)|eukprot:CAMPEP_0202377254 /NCGR_PEP_ID=MMETSP1127-20130417/8590_1 /ASSEMBLY_ACC=CAM_ASM_000462 /TAXON_ID=3047 /ORGANISM="Dunaliella tertiolecta, Strain CCMP1320" /LENGTH=388 /DNA_ID=CAMNT_0048975225 /DNA_START=70 /DNA_END=1236 /DNA_ORIENTATION=-